ncbi:T9SS C-terminal target domain-containing protein [Sphingobacteriales bacterium UPWRP_1]|nr:hypothetical protein B6N25_07230 [Sphingobacteriales bacterium TSM_CSS]PSJ78687.1 T9SS C-terminal target domain-containing protein [Sphingobacteriales bacterium UPWRP_1]
MRVQALRSGLFFLLFMFLFSAGTRAQVVINEVMASNSTTAADEMGEYDDWVELFNNAQFSISLNGYFLSDDSLILNKWPFPNISIAGRDYLIIWTDKDPEQGPLHTGFKLDAAGETVLLVNPLLAIIDGVAYNTQAADTSIGRYPNGIGAFVPMLPTFDGPNQQGIVTAVHDLQPQSRLTVYPNPATDAALITLPVLPAAGSAETLLQLYGINGTLVKQLKLPPNAADTQIVLPVSHLPQGRYVLVYTSGNTLLTSGLNIVH